MVKINKVTTKTGDEGSSKIKKNKISKNDAMFSILGDFDELNASLAHCISLNKKERKANKLLFQLQNKLFDIGAEFLSNNNFSKQRYRLGLEEIEWLEKINNELIKKLKPLDSFIIPSGSPQVTYIHVTRTICRRVERNLVNFYDKNNVKKNMHMLAFINRLSDFLFNLSRYLNRGKENKEHLWQINKNLIL